MPVGRMLKSSLKTRYRMSPESLGIRPVGIPKGELTGHAKVENEVAAVQLKEQVFSASAQALYRLPKDVLSQAMSVDL